MFASLLVPLDRSPAAELALPFAAAIAERANAAMELVAVHHSYVHDDPHAANAWALKLDPEVEAGILKEEQAYLTDAAKRAASGRHVSATTIVLSGSVVDPWAVAERILEEAQSKRADLIVMTTRVRRLASRMGLGSVADQLVRRAHVPTLLVWPGQHEPPRAPEPVLDNFLIPLDGSPFSEKILVAASELARLMGARCTLLHVVAAKAGPSEIRQAGQHLKHIAAEHRSQGLAMETLVVAAAHPAEAILNEAQARKCNLIALATHGYGGFKRLVLGSVADKIIRHAELPVLVHCPASK